MHELDYTTTFGSTGSDKFSTRSTRYRSYHADAAAAPALPAGISAAACCLLLLLLRMHSVLNLVDLSDPSGAARGAQDRDCCLVGWPLCRCGLGAISGLPPPRSSSVCPQTWRMSDQAAGVAVQPTQLLAEAQAATELEGLSLSYFQWRASVSQPIRSLQLFRIIPNYSPITPQLLPEYSPINQPIRSLSRVARHAEARAHRS
eukprot:SAG31_NODE_1416_length_8441_cov_11.436706_2_plen_203_part_00